MQVFVSLPPSVAVHYNIFIISYHTVSDAVHPSVQSNCPSVVHVWKWHLYTILQPITGILLSHDFVRI